MNQFTFKHWLKSFSQSPEVSKPLIMGILNITPDSFSDAGSYYKAPRQAVEKALRMIEDGADIIDIGGESSRPGANHVSEEEELSRVIPIIEKLRAQSDICISIDTVKPRVMQEAIWAGASFINDIEALSQEKSLAVAADLNVPVCLMHMKGKPKNMQNNIHYEEDIIEEINSFFLQKIKICLEAGIRLHNLILDPGFGFGKSDQHNLQMMNQIGQFKRHNLPVMIGFSRKATLGKIVNKLPQHRIFAGIAVAIFAALNGAAIIRTHDVDETVQALKALYAIQNERMPISTSTIHGATN